MDFLNGVGEPFFTIKKGFPPDFFSDTPPPLLLAPLEDVTNYPFRSVCRSIGADIVYTEFVNSEALKREVVKTKEKLLFKQEDRPIGIQIYGSNPDSITEAARIVEEYQPDFIDLNFGCPTPTVVKHGGGAALLKDLKIIEEICQKVVKSVSLPISAKTRLGWDKNNISILEQLKIFEQSGIAFVAIHGRTKAQKFGGLADWKTIAMAKQSTNLPIIANGDVWSLQDAINLYRTTQSDGLMIGRAAMHNPWIFQYIKQHWKEYFDSISFSTYPTGDHTLPPPPNIITVIDTVLQHIHIAEEVFEESQVYLACRRHFSIYLRGFKQSRKMRERLSHEKHPAVWKDILMEWREEVQEEGEGQGGC